MTDDVIVKISAQIAELQTGMSQATSLIKGMADQVSSAFKGAENSGSSFGGKLNTALNLGLFLEFKEVATEALSAVRGAFDATVGKAEEFGLTTAKFAAQMGMSMTEAAALSSALDDVGASTEQYSGMAMRMTMRLKENEVAWNSLGVKTRDASGNLLQGKELIDSAVSTMQSFKQGTDQNSFAMEVFGRSAAGVYDIMRVTDELIQQNKETMAEFGVVTGDQAAGAAAKLQLALADTKDQFEFAAISIGQHLMPVVTDLVNQFNGVLTPALKFAIQFFQALAVEALMFVEVFKQVGIVIGGVVAEMVVALMGFGQIAYDVFTGQWGKIGSDFQAYTTSMKKVFDETLTQMGASAVSFAEKVKSIYSGIDKPSGTDADKNPFKSTGTRSFVDPKQTLALNQEILQAAQQRALEEVKIEQEKNAQIYALGQKSLDDFINKAKELEDRKYEIEVDGVHKKMQLDAGNVLEVQKDKDKLLMLELTHQEALNRIEAQGAQQRRAMDDSDRQFASQMAETRLQDAMAHNQALLQQNAITEEEEFALEKQLTTEVYGENLARLDAEIATLAKGTKAWQQAMQERAKLQQQFSSNMRKIDDQLAIYEKQKWNTLGSSIKSSFTGALNGMLLGTKTWQQGVGEIIDGIAESFLKMAEDMLTKWIATELEKLFFTKAVNAATKADSATTHAPSAAMGAYDATVGIPYVGPFLAPAAAATAYAGVMAFAEHGMMVDQDQPVFAHKKEMILPANISGGLQAMIKNGGSSRGGDSHLHYSPNVQGAGGSLSDMLQRESKAMRDWLHGGLRDGSLKLAKG